MALFPNRNMVLEAEKREMEWKARYFQALNDLRAANRGLQRLSRNNQRLKGLVNGVAKRDLAKRALNIDQPLIESKPATTARDVIDALQTAMVKE
jgi:hypothetical protein